MKPPQRTQRSKSTATTVRRRVSATPSRCATSRTTRSASDSKGVSTPRASCAHGRSTRRARRASRRDRPTAGRRRTAPAARRACSRRRASRRPPRRPTGRAGRRSSVEALDAAQAEVWHEEVPAQVPVRARKVRRAEPPPRFEDRHPVALLGEPQRGDAAAEPASDHEHVGLVQLHGSEDTARAAGTLSGPRCAVSSSCSRSSSPHRRRPRRSRGRCTAS